MSLFINECTLSIKKNVYLRYVGSDQDQFSLIKNTSKPLRIDHIYSKQTTL